MRWSSSTVDMYGCTCCEEILPFVHVPDIHEHARTVPLLPGVFMVARCSTDGKIQRQDIACHAT